MKRILYSSGSVLTGDQIADVVIEYARELAKLETSATVDIPAVMGDGTVHDAKLLLGPASQLAAVDEESGTALNSELEAGVVASLRTSIDSLRPKASPVTDVDLTATDPYDT